MTQGPVRLGRVSSTIPGSLVLVLDAHDTRWLCGFTGSTARLVVDPAVPRGWCVVDGRYRERAEAEVAEHSRLHGGEVEVVPMKAGETHDDALARVVGSRAVTVDPNQVTLAAFRAMATRMSLEAADTNIAELRRVKTSVEIELIRRAASIADASIQTVVAEGLCGLSEAAIRNRLDEEMRRLGADDVSFPTIVAAGANAARPHHAPTDKVVEAGEAVIIDMGAAVGGYRSDMTRTVFVGDPSPEIEAMYEVVRRAQAAAAVQVRAGAVGREVDRAARSLFEHEGLGHEYLHSTGHGVGLAIHERPILGPACDAVLLEGEVVTAEPGLYRKGVGGVRIEDLLVVADGPPQPLTLTPKELQCPPSPRTT